MPSTNQFGDNYLGRLLRSAHLTAEEYAGSKAKIDAYFKHLDAEREKTNSTPKSTPKKAQTIPRSSGFARPNSAAAEMRDKLAAYDKFFARLLYTKNLKAAYGPAEECLAVLHYLDQHASSGQRKSPFPSSDPKFERNEIDPIHTLIERLIEVHRLDAADQLSRLYLSWLNPEWELENSVF